MPKPIFSRLREYYIKVAEVLRGEADVASIFPNTTDIGLSREGVYAEFLRSHLPTKCNVFLGGFVFDENETESKQLDIIITTDTTPRFRHRAMAGLDKSFSPIEGTLGVVSVKSNLDKNQLIDALEGIASIPSTAPLDKRVNPSINIPNYEDWPLKVIYSTASIKPETLMSHLHEFYRNHPEIPLNRQPHVIHVAGSCCIVRITEGYNIQSIETKLIKKTQIGEYHLLTTDSDLQAIIWTLNILQKNAVSATHILFTYDYILNNVLLRADKK